MQNRVMMPSLLRSFLPLLIPCFLSIGCLEPGVPSQDSEDKLDSWNNEEDPVTLGDFIYDWDELNGEELLSSTTKRIPWAGSFWESRKDGYNYRWNTGFSAMELYDKSFNEWGEHTTKWFEAFLTLRPFSAPGKAYDVEYYQNLGRAAQWAHEDGGNTEALARTNPKGGYFEQKSKRTETEEWGGIESWFGHCNGWASAAITYPEPKHAVIYRGTTFEVPDIKALVDAVMEEGGSTIIGGNCDVRGDEVIERDKYGRILNESCGINAGSFHVVLLNLLGLQKKSFITDISHNQEVWNHPALGYKITVQEEVGITKALSLLGVDTYPSSEATRFVQIQLEYQYMIETFEHVDLADRDEYYMKEHSDADEYSYVLELDAEGMILGGEWIAEFEHPDFIWIPNGPTSISTWWGTSIIEKKNVETLVRLSLE